jgi:proline- and glutamine-rich splicing factor
MPAETTEDEFKAMFAEHGEFTEVFLNSGRGFGFIRMASYFNFQNVE